MEQINWFDGSIQDETPAKANKKFLYKMAKKYNDKLSNGELLLDDDWKVLAEIEIESARRQLQHEILMKIIFGDSD